MQSSLPYHEPSIQTILIQSSFLILLNAVNHVLDSAIYAGLVGQILIGVAWGVPGGQILDLDAQHVAVQLGYIGLILIVFEGGLSTNLADLKANIWLSTCVAITGIAVPIGLSFVLPSLLGGSGASPLQAFAAGAALCSTSLGTTFTLLATSGLGSCRLGVVLSSAAMMDDVVGLVMVQIISDLGASSSAIGAGTVLRPILTSLAFAIALPLAWNYVGVPVARKLYAAGQGSGIAVVRRVVNHELVPLVGLTATLIAVVTGASYAGSSPLLGAYVAGIMVSWWDQQGKTQPAEAVPRPSEGEQSNSTETDRPQEDGPRQEASDAAPKTAGENDGPQEQEQEQEQHASTDGAAVFEKYYLPALQRILRPLFFASVGFSIPITKMFSGAIVWRGIVYAILMAIGKLMCGLWLVRVSMGPSAAKLQRLVQMARRVVLREGNKAGNGGASTSVQTPESPLSLYPGLILGSAMMSRGEIGYLISSLAESGGVFSGSGSSSGSGDGPSDMFLIATWAITLCTVAGPITMGLLVDRVRKLEEGKASGTRGTVLGQWGPS